MLLVAAQILAVEQSQTIQTISAERDQSLQTVLEFSDQLAAMTGNKAWKIALTEFAALHAQLTEACQRIANLKQTVESAERWQKRSWFKHFHKWRRPDASREKIGFLKKLERSIRKWLGLN